MFKFEMQIGWLSDGKVSIETNDFDVIAILKDFIEFQEQQGWVECFDFSTINEDDEEDDSDETDSEQVIQ
jgi:hypothetical protein